MRLLTYVFAAALLIATGVSATVQVVTTTSDLAYFSSKVGGAHVAVTAIASPSSDVHFVEVRPSYMLKVNKADIVFKVGLELDMWMDQIIDGSRNNNLVVIDCSEHIQPLEVPTFNADARHGDLHRFGNPHYWLTPANVEPITEAIVAGLSTIDPDHAADFQANQKALLEEIAAGLANLQSRCESLRGQELVFYHNSWPYFNDYVGTKAADFIEPYPGVPPSPTHVKELIDLVAARSIKVIAVEPYFDKRVPEKIAASTGAKVVQLYPSIGGRQEGESYIQWFEGNLNALVEALR